LKTEKKKWSHELICATTITKTKVAKMRAELKNFGTVDLKHLLRYDVVATWVTNWTFYLNCVMQGEWIVATFYIWSNVAAMTNLSSYQHPRARLFYVLKKRK